MAAMAAAGPRVGCGAGVALILTSPMGRRGCISCGCARICSRAALRVVFDRYGAAFAKRCHLELADQGQVPKLFAEAWYDDGVTPWSENRVAQLSS